MCVMDIYIYIYDICMSSIYIYMYTVYTYHIHIYDSIHTHMCHHTHTVVIFL